MKKSDLTQLDTLTATTLGQLDAAAAPAPVKKKDHKRVCINLSSDNYIHVKGGTGALGCNMSELLDYAFGVFYEEHPEAFGNDDAAKDVIRKRIWDLE